MRAVVVRPAIVYGHGGGIPAMLVASARERGAARHVGDGDNHWPLVHADDLAALYLRAVEAGEAGTLLHAVASHHRVREVAAAAADAAGADGRTESWPLAAAREELRPFADAFALDQRVSARRAAERLGWRPQGPSLLDDLRAGSYAGGGSV